MITDDASRQAPDRKPRKGATMRASVPGVVTCVPPGQPGRAGDPAGEPG